MTENNTKNKGGRPKTELTHEQIQEVEKLAGSLNIKQIADYLDISVATFHRLKAKDSEVMRAYKKGVAHKIHHYAQLLESKADGSNPEVDATSTIFFLKTKAGWSTDSSMKLKVEIPEDATPLDILNMITRKLSNEGLTPTEFKQLTDLAQLKQQLIDLQPNDDTPPYKPSLEKCLEISEKLLGAHDIMELQRENRELKEKLEAVANA